mgnify:CR=1 FL=1
MFKTCYSPRYYAHTPTNSMEKLTAVANALAHEQITDLIDPGIIEPERLYSVHNPDYVDAFIAGQKPLASMQGFKKWNEQLRDAILSVQAGQLKAAELAWQEGISANIAQGFHHAVYDHGNAFCTFNGLALVAKQFPDKKIFILDCDQHGGNGTAEYTRFIPNLFNFSIYGLAFGCATYEQSITRHIHPKTGNFDEYTQAVFDGFEHAQEWGADLIIYQAGMDCHRKDRFGSKWFSTDLLYDRDQLVFALAKKHKFPLMFVLAGGYQKLDELVPLHVNTFKAANSIYFPELYLEPCH